MPSEFIIEVCEIKEVRPHPGADRLDLCIIKGWQTCAPRGKHQVGDKVVFFPPDTLFPGELAKRLGVSNYLKQLPKLPDGTLPSGGRVGAIRLRGEPSYGFITSPDDPTWPVGMNVADHYGVTKWIPVPKAIDGDAETPHPGFHPYVDIESYGNYPNVFTEGEEVVVTEKLHGFNCRMALVRDGDEWVMMAGSHSIRRKPVDKQKRPSRYWAFFDDRVKDLLEVLRTSYDTRYSVILYGEIVGPGVQDMHYGLLKPHLFAFDISLDGKYMDKDMCYHWLEQFTVAAVPPIYAGPFHADLLPGWTSGPTLMCEPENIKGFKGREGCVIVPAMERTSEELRFRRAILKSKSVDYEARKGAKDEGE